MIPGKSFFTLQLPFARHVAAVTGIAEDDALLRYTLYYAFVAQDRDLGRHGRADFDPMHPGWRAFLAAMHAGMDAVDYVYDQTVASLPPNHGDSRRCFTYDWEAETRTVRLHFGNNAPNGTALQAPEIPARRAELRGIVAEVAAQHPEAARVRGGPWLYNLPAYCRLFPPEYVAAIHPIGYEYQFFALWGQFLNRHGEVKPELRDRFLAALAHAETMDAIDACFPYQVLATRCDIAHFYACFAVSSPLLSAES